MWLKLSVATILLLGTAAIAYVLHRRLRSASARAIALGDKNGQRLAAQDIEQLIAAYRKDRALAAIAEPLRAYAAPSAMAGITPPAGAVVKLKEQFLGSPNRLLYLVLKAALPDHQIFAQVRLADALSMSGQPATPQARAQLAQARVDFVVCNKALAVVALVDITDGNRADDVLKRQIEPYILAGGGRYLRIAPNAIPKPGQARALVCGVQS